MKDKIGVGWMTVFKPLLTKLKNVTNNNLIKDQRTDFIMARIKHILQLLSMFTFNVKAEKYPEY